MEFKQNRTEIEAIKLAITSLPHNEVSIGETIRYSIELLLRNYAELENETYLLQALNHLWASLELGIPYEDNEAIFDKLLTLCNMDKELVIYLHGHVSKKLLLTKNRLKTTIGRWRRGLEDDPSFEEVIDDIYNRIVNKSIGKKMYISHRKDGSIFARYELIINGQNNILRDLIRKRYYFFEVTNR